MISAVAKATAFALTAKLSEWGLGGFLDFLLCSQTSFQVKDDEQHTQIETISTMHFFALVTLTLSLTTTVTEAQKARKMRASVVVGEGRAGHGDGLLPPPALSMSMPSPPSKLVPSELPSAKVDLSQHHLRFEETVLGAAIAKWNEDAATSANNGTSSTGTTTTTSSHTHSTSTSSKSGGRSSKSAKTCDKRLTLAKEAIEALTDTYDVSLEDITAACSFRSSLNLSGDSNSPVPLEKDPSPNMDCPSPANFAFLTKDDYETVFPFPYGNAMRQFTSYCECHQGYELNCINKIAYPEYGPESEFTYPGDTGSNMWKEYCKFVGIWNGDIDYSEYNKLSSDVKNCGCYFIFSARDMIRNCAGVDLFTFRPRTNIVGNFDVDQ